MIETSQQLLTFANGPGCACMQGCHTMKCHIAGAPFLACVGHATRHMETCGQPLAQLPARPPQTSGAQAIGCRGFKNLAGCCQTQSSLCVVVVIPPETPLTWALSLSPVLRAPAWPNCTSDLNSLAQVPLTHATTGFVTLPAHPSTASQQAGKLFHGHSEALTRHHSRHAFP